MKPGIYHSLSNADYHASEGVSNSGLNLVAACPALYYALCLDHDRPQQKERAGQLEGNLAHCAILEPHEFSNRYIVCDANGNTKAFKSFASTNKDREIIKKAQYDVAWRQAESVFKLGDVAECLTSGNAEVSAYWIDDETDALCKCRPDFVHRTASGDVILFDVKTFSSADPQEFSRQAARKGYFRQAAMYSEGYAEADGVNVLAFLFIVVATEWPYFASIIELDERALELGREQWHNNLRIYAECKATNMWPGYGSNIETVSLPSWVFRDSTLEY